MAISNQTRRQVTDRAAGRCEYCRCPADHTPDDYSVEHIHPSARGGADGLDNLAWSCAGCNSRKYTATEATDPLTGRPAALFHPRRDAWADHFQWSPDTLTLLGLTPTGRATVSRLQLNRAGVVNLRELLVRAGKHPPPDT